MRQNSKQHSKPTGKGDEMMNDALALALCIDVLLAAAAISFALDRVAKAIRDAHEAVTEILSFLDEQTPDDASMEHWAARDYQEIGRKFL